LHVTCTLLVYALVRQLLAPRGARRAAAVALLTAAIFGIYPRHHQVIMWFGAVSIGLAATFALATTYTGGIQAVFDDLSLPWSITQLGARAEYRFTPEPPRNGTASHEAHDQELDDYLHLSLANRGILLTPFHNMALMCPETTAEDVQTHVALFRETVTELVG